MAEESIIDRAIGLIPGVARRPRRAGKPPTAQAQFAALQRNLTRLAKDVEKLGDLLAGGAKNKPARRAARVTPARAAAKRSRAKARTKRKPPKHD